MYVVGETGEGMRVKSIRTSNPVVGTGGEKAWGSDP